MVDSKKFSNHRTHTRAGSIGMVGGRGRPGPLPSKRPKAHRISPWNEDDVGVGVTTAARDDAAARIAPEPTTRGPHSKPPPPPSLRPATGSQGDAYTAPTRGREGEELPRPVMPHRCQSPLRCAVCKERPRAVALCSIGGVWMDGSGDLRSVLNETTIPHRTTNQLVSPLADTSPIPRPTCAEALGCWLAGLLAFDLTPRASVSSWPPSQPSIHPHARPSQNARRRRHTSSHSTTAACCLPPAACRSKCSPVRLLLALLFGHAASKVMGRCAIAHIDGY